MGRGERKCQQHIDIDWPAAHRARRQDTCRLNPEKNNKQYSKGRKASTGLGLTHLIDLFVVGWHRGEHALHHLWRPLAQHPPAAARGPLCLRLHDGAHALENAAEVEAVHDLQGRGEAGGWITQAWIGAKRQVADDSTVANGGPGAA